MLSQRLLHPRKRTCVGGTQLWLVCSHAKANTELQPTRAPPQSSVELVSPWSMYIHPMAASPTCQCFAQKVLQLTQHADIHAWHTQALRHLQINMGANSTSIGCLFCDRITL